MCGHIFISTKQCQKAVLDNDDWTEVDIQMVNLFNTVIIEYRSSIEYIEYN